MLAPFGDELGRKLPSQHKLSKTLLLEATLASSIILLINLIFK